MQQDADPYLTHSRWSDPHHLAPRVLEIPPVPALLPRVVSGFILHPFLARMRNLDLPVDALEEPSALLIGFSRPVGAAAPPAPPAPSRPSR